MQMFQAISLWFCKHARSAKACACAAFDERYPSLRRKGCSCVRRDGSNLVVAVFYSTGMPSRPEPYKVFLVDPVLKTVNEIDLSTQPQYAIRGRK
jgi:hypothetical protein